MKRFTKQQKAQWLEQIWKCLVSTYSRHYERAVYYQMFTNRLENNEHWTLRKAQFGGKWGNYNYVITYNEKTNKYETRHGWNN